MQIQHALIYQAVNLVRAFIRIPEGKEVLLFLSSFFY